MARLHARLPSRDTSVTEEAVTDVAMAAAAVALLLIVLPLAKRPPPRNGEVPSARSRPESFANPILITNVRPPLYSLL